MYKAGGTSMRKLIRDQYPQADVVEVDGAIPELEAWRAQQETLRHSQDLLLGHQFFGNHDFVRPGASYITVLRDPIERVISFYYYVLRMPDHYLYRYGFEPQMSLRELYEKTRCVELDNLQVRMMNPQPTHHPVMGSVDDRMMEIAERNLRYIADHGVVGVVEHMPELLEVLERDEGWDVSTMTRSNATARRPSAESLDPETLDIIVRSNQYDIRLHKLATELFQERLHRSRSGAAVIAE
jgi:hypothetical protein